MTIQDTMNAALVSRGMMPMDGYCTCESCNKSGLDRDDLSAAGYCRDCIEDAEGYGAYSTDRRSDEETFETRYDYVRQARVQI